MQAARRSAASETAPPHSCRTGKWMNKLESQDCLLTKTAILGCSAPAVLTLATHGDSSTLLLWQLPNRHSCIPLTALPALSAPPVLTSAWCMRLQCQGAPPMLGRHQHTAAARWLEQAHSRPGPACRCTKKKSMRGLICYATGPHVKPQVQLFCT